jgi:hypothetical protein
VNTKENIDNEIEFLVRLKEKTTNLRTPTGDSVPGWVFTEETLQKLTSRIHAFLSHYWISLPRTKSDEPDGWILSKREKSKKKLILSTNGSLLYIDKSRQKRYDQRTSIIPYLATFAGILITNLVHKTILHTPISSLPLEILINGLGGILLAYISSHRIRYYKPSAHVTEWSENTPFSSQYIFSSLTRLIQQAEAKIQKAETQKEKDKERELYFANPNLALNKCDEILSQAEFPITLRCWPKVDPTTSLTRFA